MMLRPINRVLPQNYGDICCCLLVVIFVPITYIFEMTVMLPDIHEFGSCLYIMTWVAGLFLIFNLTGNYLAIMLVDTTIRTELLKPPIEPAKRKLWRMCDACQALAPPRSWHCDLCKICVLKRDHHCKFSGCCIGHHNHRYFFYFLLYMSIGTIYSTIYNSIYFWHVHADEYVTKATLIKVIFPLFMLGINPSWSSLHLFIYELNIIGLMLAVTLLVYHAPMITRGAVSYEGESTKYDLGYKRNFVMVMGKRWYLTWLSPFVRSELPHNGIDWEPIKQN